MFWTQERVDTYFKVGDDLLVGVSEYFINGIFFGCNHEVLTVQYHDLENNVCYEKFIPLIEIVYISRQTVIQKTSNLFKKKLPGNDNDTRN